MAKGAYIGVDNVARKIKKGYIGVDGKARKIKKAYIGIGGVARPCWSGGELAYYGRDDDGAVTGLSVARFDLTGISTPNYALFAGGIVGSESDSYYLDAYSSSLTRTTGNVYESRYQCGGCYNGTYAIFAGGYHYEWEEWEDDEGNTGADLLYSSVSTAYGFNSSLTRTKLTDLKYSRGAMGTARVGNYALFHGGANYDRTYPMTVTEAYNSAGTRSDTSEYPTYGGTNLAGASVGNYALFAGGAKTTTNRYAYVNSYNTSLTLSSRTALSVARHYLTGVSVGNYALFGGGFTGDTSGYSAVVDAYNTSLTRTTATALKTAAGKKAATTLGNYALFGGGKSQWSYLSEVDVYDTSLTKTSISGFTQGRSNLAAASAGDYAFFAGGTVGGYLNDVAVYTIA